MVNCFQRIVFKEDNMVGGETPNVMFHHLSGLSVMGDVTDTNGFFQIILDTLPWYLAMTNGKFTVQSDHEQVKISHPEDISCPT